jgi:A/G-specific adenine glycosylase
MLQQTQVDRVVPKYESFMQRWPTVRHLAQASLRDVLVEWQGLGYNRRAKYLHRCALTITSDWGGVFPKTQVDLERLPGIGPYTAGAIMAFAYDTPTVIIETNIRTVFIHHFFQPHTSGVDDAAILALVKKTLPESNSREWYAALMDYGAHLKKTVGNLNRHSATYKKQSTFKGSDRAVRGAILRALSACEAGVTKTKLRQELRDVRAPQLQQQLDTLQADELISKQGRHYVLG